MQQKASLIDSAEQPANAAVDSSVKPRLPRAFAGQLVPAETEIARGEGRRYESVAEPIARITTTEPTPALTPKSKRAKPATKPSGKKYSKRREARK